YVSPSFKCILVMDEKNLALADPAFLNRFEKHKMSIHDTLNDRHKLLVENLSNWARQISTLIGVNQIAHLYEKFTQKDLFIGFDKDEVIQSLVFDITLVAFLKEFVYKFLKNYVQEDNSLFKSLIKEINDYLNLSMYFFDFTLDLWTSDIKQELVERLFPTCLLVSHAYDSYIYIVNEKAMVDKQINQNLSTVSSTRRTLQRIKKVKT
ncbi:19558_t:CDS:2, partial [Funneliformis geosporum]